ncbi:MAG TPA: hypothetical protein VD995_04530 [Azospirillum sp.]|nr:hypothetical protein [Azospirillum sp.]
MVGAVHASISAAAAAAWKPVVNPSSGGTSSVLHAGSSRSDTVSVSELGRKLSGVAAEVFAHFDSKAKSALEGLVNSGRISADEAVVGLRALATDATFSRYQDERTLTAEDTALFAENQELDERRRRAHNAFAEAGRPHDEAIRELDASFKRGEMSEEEFTERLNAGFADFARATESAIEDMRRVLEERSARGAKGAKLLGADEFSAFVAGDTSENGFVQRDSEAGWAAKRKLEALGFNSRLYGEAMREFADTVDLPGVGRKADPLTSSAAGGPAATEAAGAGPGGLLPNTVDATTVAATGAAGGALAAIDMLQRSVATMSGTFVVGNTNADPAAFASLLGAARNTSAPRA